MATANDDRTDASARKGRACGEPATVYEHRDYAQPLNTQPVCAKCNSRRGSAEGWKPSPDKAASDLKAVIPKAIHHAAKVAATIAEMSLAELVAEALQSHPAINLQLRKLAKNGGRK